MAQVRVGVGGAGGTVARMEGRGEPRADAAPPRAPRSLKGTRFRISRATLFNVEAPSGELVGQAAVIRAWEWEDGTKGGEGVAEEGEGAGAAGSDAALAAATPDDLAAAEAAVAEQAARVRGLKEEGGLGNGSEEVQAAVAELLARKEALAALQQGRAG